MASLISPCGPAKIWKKQYENYLEMDIRRPMKLQMGREQKPQIQQPKK